MIFPCFLLKDNSIEGIYDTLKQCASILEAARDIGVAMSSIRANGNYIRDTHRDIGRVV